MSLINKYAANINQANSKIYDLESASTNKIDHNYATRFSLVGYVVSMFRIENNHLRSRKISQPPWNESFNNKVHHSRPIFQVGDCNRRPEIPIAISLNHESETTAHKSRFRKFCKNVEEYCSNSSLHGLRYVGNPSLSLGERLFWLCSFFSAVGFAAFFISSLYTRYNQSPIIISINPTPTPLASLPFPAVTICSTNQVKKQEADIIMNSGTDVEKMLLYDYCKINSLQSNSTQVTEEATKWENVQRFIIRVSPSCQDILKVCFWRENEMPCSNLFNNDLTDDGLCCTFNALPRNYTFRNPREMSDLNLSIPSEVDDWNPERGYSQNASFEALPWRALGAGTHLGLTVVLDAQIKWYFCSSVNSVGFKVLLHNPLETPKMADYALLVAPGLESRIKITPRLSDATRTLRSLAIKKRRCYFTNEKELQFYRTYTERNCKLECQTNYTLSMCNCVPFYLPKNRFNRICSKTQEACSNTAKIAMETSLSNKTNCNCLPACFELGFGSTSTFSRLSDMFQIRDEIIKNESADYFKDNMAILQFYFKYSQYTSNTKSEIYGFSEFLSNTGGLLGLFLGFSFLSAVEVIYYLSLKMLCTIVRSTNRKDRQKKKDQIGSNTAPVYPFSQ